MAEQAVGVIYKLAEHPDVICGNILKKLAAKCVMLQRQQQQQQQELSQTEPVSAENGDDILAAAGDGDSQSSTSQQSSSQSQDGAAETSTRSGCADQNDRFGYLSAVEEIRQSARTFAVGRGDRDCGTRQHH